MNEEIENLLEQTSRTRYQFLRVEIQTCITALQMGEYQIKTGNLDVARREAEIARKGTEVIRRFLPELAPPQREELGTQLATVEKMLEELKSNLDCPPPGLVR